MARLFSIVATVFFMGFVSSGHQLNTPAYFYPVEHRSDLATFKELFPLSSYDYTIIPNDEKAVTEYVAKDLSLWELVPSPITAVTAVASKALSGAKFIISKALSAVKCVVSKALKLAKFLVPKAILIVLGVALVIGFCAFTPYCTLIIEKPFLHELRMVGDRYPYLDYAEDFLLEAYNKYKEMRNV